MNALFFINISSETLLDGKLRNPLYCATLIKIKFNQKIFPNICTLDQDEPIDLPS